MVGLQFGSETERTEEGTFAPVAEAADALRQGRFVIIVVSVPAVSLPTWSTTGSPSSHAAS